MKKLFSFVLISLVTPAVLAQSCPAGLVVADDSIASAHIENMLAQEEAAAIKEEMEQDALDFKAIKSDEVFRLDFDALSNGFFKDSSSRPITVNYTGTASQSLVSGVAGSSIAKTPTSGKLTASPVPITLNDADGASISLWFKTNKTNSMTLLDNRTAATNGVGVSLNYYNGGVMLTVACGANGARNYQSTPTSPLTDNSWQHVAVNITNKVTIFVNGTPSQAFDISWCTAPLAGSSTLNIGENNFWAHWAFTGSIDEVRVNSSVYTEDQLLDQTSVSRLGARSVPGSAITVTPEYCNVDVDYSIPNAYVHYDNYVICLKKSANTIPGVNDQVCDILALKIESTNPSSSGSSDHSLDGLEDETTYNLAIAGVVDDCFTDVNDIDFDGNKTETICQSKYEEINELKTTFTTKKSNYSNSISVENVTSNKVTVKWTQECGVPNIGLCVKKKGFWRDVGECNTSNRTYIDATTSDPNLVLIDGVNSGKYTFCGLKASTTYYAKGWLSNQRGYENRLSDSLRWPKFKTKSASSTFKVDVSKSSNSITLTWKTDQQFDSYKVCRKPSWNFSDTCDFDYVMVPGNTSSSGITTYSHTFVGLQKNKKYKLKIYGESTTCGGAKPVKLWKDKVKTNKR
ncbi:hypothetical protein D0C16_06415 [Cellvibrio sp. KY-GH-1]|uniref:LamG-like jellyroll fold domain-containing protein n=1 Tax=Cellvibrio sp. KY-GH-1 TaxID=2303332 RepID=UPI001245E015|nr:LamG-like jellyroll fold domain-containing protein [Cellvibrio sp. KY-GH-1]QEY15633.1 hypothetical protein D0C16_06415 [Cellvibrio sp. KY-GH-1]